MLPENVSKPTKPKRAGFRNVRLEFFDGPHTVDPRPLKKALDWFAAEAAKTVPAK